MKATLPSAESAPIHPQPTAAVLAGRGFVFLTLLLGGLACPPGARGDASVDSPALTPTGQMVVTAPYSVTQRSADERVWEQVCVGTNRNGRAFYRTNGYVELATGLCHLSDGQWVDSDDSIHITATGGEATNNAYPVRFAGNANTPEGTAAVQLELPDGATLSSRVYGLAYLDTASGRSVLLAQIQDCGGQLIGPNEVLYSNALGGDCAADILYKFSKAGLEQNIVLEQSPPPPGDYSLNPESTVLQVLTEFFDPEQPRVSTNALGDQTLDWTSMKMGRGKAFLIGGIQGNNRAVPVMKRWVTLSQRQFLVEQVPLGTIAAELQTLPPPPPPPAGTNTQPQGASLRTPLYAFHWPDLGRPAVGQPGKGAPQPLGRQASLPSRRAAARRVPGLARDDAAGLRGFLIDYTILGSSLTNYTFQSDTTYYFSGAVSVQGTITVEGGTVLKYAPASSNSYLEGTNFVFKAGPYRPAVFTAKDDDTVGDQITGSTGTPSGYYAEEAIVTESELPTTVEGVRISYAQTGFYDTGNNSPCTDLIQDAQILNCGWGIATEGGGCCGLTTVAVENALLSGVGTAFEAADSYVWGDHVTVCGSYNLMDDSVYYDGCFGYFANSLFVNVTNVASDDVSSAGGDHDGFYNAQEFSSPAFTNATWPFQTVGAASYYLSSNCGFRDAGTTDLSALDSDYDPTNDAPYGLAGWIGTPPPLLAEFAQKTTYPPVVISPGEVYTSTNLSLFPQAQRDADALDLGFHYDPLDYVFAGVFLTNSTVTVSPGTAVGSASLSFGGGTYVSLWLDGGCTFNSVGSPTNRNWIVRYNTVQEQSNTNWSTGRAGSIEQGGNWPPTPVVYCRFTDFSSLAQDVDAYDDMEGSAYYTPVPIVFQDCQFHGGKFDTAWATIVLTNCLFERVNAYCLMQTTYPPYIRNNLFWYGTFGFDEDNVTTSVVMDNLFDHTSIPDYSGDYGSYIGGFNAYVSGSAMLQPTNATDITLTNSPSYQAGPLGNYYYPSGYQLINADTNTTANLVGLYHYTTCTNEVKETNSLLDVGYHYIAVGTNGLPFDTTGTGIPDYLKDVNGDGVVESGEINWTNGADPGLTVLITRPPNNSVVP